jgi:hypothetical protein
MESPFIYLIPITALGGSFAMSVAVVWIVMRARQRRAEMRTEVQMKLIEKFGSSAEFVKFLESPAGQQFLEQPRRMSRDRALGGLTGALVCTFIGLGFFGCALVFGDPGFSVPAFILTGIGIALFISAAISWRLTKQVPGATTPNLNP